MVKNDSLLSDILSKEKEKILACVHCGLCLESCPTYLATGNENDSPRGRIYLIRNVEEGRLQPTSSAFESHINRCLGCRACEQVCPAGVEFGNLLEGARAEISSKKTERGLAYHLQSFLLRYIWLYPKRLRFLFSFSRIIRDIKLPSLLLKTGIPSRFFPRLAFAFALLDASSPAPLNFTKNEDIAEEKETPAATEKKRSVMLFKGCVTEGLFSRINKATGRVLKANRRQTQIPAKQTCCGALHAHSGDLEGAKTLARRNIEAFAADDSPIITNAGGCGAMLCNYGHLLAEDAEYDARAKSFSARVRDISQELPNEVIQANGCGNSDAVTYDSSCHLLYGQHAAGDSLQMLLSANVNYVPLNGSDVCCGGAGIYNLLEPELSSKILGEKLDNIKNSGAKVLATGNPGCHMQIRAGMNLFENSDLKVCHPVEILDESYRCAGRYDNDKAKVKS
ncbi:MAG TPA: heterodisulfide reductase-related iron-sulfur binding cluster [Pyrinomonadaceae bacterium]|jgi:glycolate oxidase iron-sulfur subunit